MSSQAVPRQSATGPAGGGTSAPSPSLPDINAETYPFETVLHLLDQAAFFNMYSVPDPQHTHAAILATGNPKDVIGIEVREVLHRFDVIVQAPTRETGLRAVNTTRESVGEFSHRWMLIPDDFVASPDREPSPTLLDPSRSQRFAMLGGICKFGDGQDGFYGFGTGRTFPMTVNGRAQLLVGAVGDISEGFGKFKGHEGTYTYCGSIAPDRGFQGNLLCRVMDPTGSLRTESTLPYRGAVPGPEPELTYIVFRGQKKNRDDKTSYTFGPDGLPSGFKLGQELRIVDLDFTRQGREGLRSRVRVGEVIGEMQSQVFLNLLNPGAPGTGAAPIPFGSRNEFTFTDSEGRPIGSFTAQGGEGRTFNATLAGAPGQQALRFGAFQMLVNGTGELSGIQGLLTDNSIVGVAPHATSTVYTLCLIDPNGKYSAARNKARR
jgi:hypothetical protein